MVDVERVRVVAAKLLEHLGHGQEALDPGLLQDDADAAAELGTSLTGVVSEDRDLAAGASPTTFEDLDRGRLPATFGPIRANTSPRSRVRSTPATASVPR